MLNKYACGRHTWQTQLHMADADPCGRCQKRLPKKETNTEGGCKVTAAEPTAVQGAPVQEAQHLDWDVQTNVCVAEVRTYRKKPWA